MTSIRKRLLVELLGALLLAEFGAAVGVYLKAWDEANALFDYQLQQIALAWRDHTAETVEATSSDKGIAEQHVVIQIWDNAGLHRYASRPGSPLPHPAVMGFTNVTTPQGAWRVFNVLLNGHVVQVAQPKRVRQAMAANMAGRTLLPELVEIPLFGSLIWWIVGRSLKPLTDVARAVSQRQPQALAPIPAPGLPQEVQPLITALNDLLQRLSEALMAQRAFIADAAHALRTPLTAVHLQAQVVARAIKDKERQQAVTALQRGVQRASHLVHQLLTLARLEPEATQQTLVLIDLNPLLHAVIAEQAPLAAEKAIDLGLTRDDPARIMGEADSLCILFGNLLENAIRYTPAGGTIDVQITRERDAIGVEVADTGPGIPPEDRAHVFDRFSRGDTTDVSGSGLGLAIVKTIAERHHAQISLGERACGTGLVVRLTFPHP
jgi:two-component system OmpR family sensor kinase